MTEWSVRDGTEDEIATVGFNARMAVEKVLPGARITQGYRDPKSRLGRKNTKTTHFGIDTVDIAPIPGMTFEQTIKHFRDTGHDVIGARDEVKNPSPWSTGPHWHFRLAPTKAAATAKGGWSLVGDAQAATPAKPSSIPATGDPFDPEGKNQAVYDQMDADYRKLSPEQQAAMRSRGGNDQGMAVIPGAEEGSWGERVGNALTGSVIPDEYARYDPTGTLRGINGALALLGGATEAIRGTPVGALADAFPTGLHGVGGMLPKPTGARLPSAIEEGWRNVLNVGSKDEILQYADENGFKTTPESLDDWVMKRDGQSAQTVYDGPGEAVDYSPQPTEGLEGRVTDEAPYDYTQRAASQGARSTDSTLPPRTVDEEAIVQKAIQDEAEFNDFTPEQLQRAMGERDFLADVKMNLAKNGHDQNLVHQPEFMPDAPTATNALDNYKTSTGGQRPFESNDNLDYAVGEPYVAPTGTRETFSRMDGSGRRDTHDVTTYTTEEMLAKFGNRDNVVPLDRPVGPGDVPEDILPGQPVNDNRFTYDSEGRIVSDARDKYVTRQRPENQQLTAINDRIDMLDEAYARETDPVKKNRFAEEQDALIAEEKAIRAKLTPQNNNKAETVEQAVERAGDAYNDVAFTQGLYEGPVYDAAYAEYVQATRNLAKTFDDEYLATLVDRGRNSGTPYDEAMRAEQASRQAPPSAGPGGPPRGPGGPAGGGSGGSGGPGGPAGGGSNMGPHDVGGVIDRFMNHLATAGRLNKQQSAARTAELREKFGEMAKVRQYTSGEAGLYAEKGTLRGERVKVEMEPSRDKFTVPEITSLFEHIKYHPNLVPIEAFHARIGLAKMLDGQLPQKSELALLGKVFPKPFLQAAMKNRTRLQKFRDEALDILTIPRTLMSTLDLSAPLRQGLFLINRKEWWNSLGPMAKALFSEDYHHQLMTEIKSRPSYEKMVQSKLGLAEHTVDLNAAEEAFASRYARMVPGVKASERAYTGFLNKLRADTFDSLLRDARAAGRNVDAEPELVADMARFINNATGRGNIGSLGSAGPILNAMFFSPRLIASRVNLLNPLQYYKLDPLVRREALKSAAALGAIAVTVTNLAKAGGAEVETDMRSSNFARIKDGKITHDILGGFGGYITFASRLASGETKTRAGEVKKLGEGYGQDTGLDVMQNFIVGKLSPVASLIADWQRGKDYTGKEFDWSEALIKRVTPMYAADAVEILKETGATPRAVQAIPGAFGVGGQVQKDKNSWSTESDTSGEWKVL